MEHVVISISTAERAFLDSQVEQGTYDSVSDYVAALVTAEARSKAQERLEALLLEGLEGEPLEWTPELLSEIKRNAGLDQ